MSKTEGSRPRTPQLDENVTTVTSRLEEPLLPAAERHERHEDRRSDDDDSENRPHPSHWIVDGLPFETSVLIKSLYFLDALGSSTWGRFSAIYYNLHGLDSRHIGLIEGVRSVVPTLSMVVWGIVADRCHSRKLVWLVTKSVSTMVLLTLALPWIYTSFWRILAVSSVAQLFVSDGILDAYTLDLLGTENKIFYGRYRLCASVSWGLGSIIMGWVTDHYGFEPNFVLFALLGFLMIALVGTKIPETTAPPQMEIHHTAADDTTEGNLGELISLALRPRVVIFLLEVIVMGAGMATVERLLFLYLVNDLQASTLLCGFSVGVNVLFELPIFWYASNFMAVLGHDGMFMVAMFCFVIRVYGYTLLTPSTRWLILVLEVMHGITFACFWVVCTDISKMLVHQTRGAFWSTAIPSSVQMLYSALGVSLGSIAGGWAMNRFGSREMYTFTAGIMAGALVLHVLGSVLSRLLFDGESFLPNYPHSRTEAANNEQEDTPVMDSIEPLITGGEEVEGPATGVSDA